MSWQALTPEQAEDLLTAPWSELSGEYLRHLVEEFDRFLRMGQRKKDSAMEQTISAALRNRTALRVMFTFFICGAHTGRGYFEREMLSAWEGETLQ